MSALGQKQTWRTLFAMSALPPNADIRRMLFDVSFGPKTDPCTATWISETQTERPPRRGFSEIQFGAATVEVRH